MSSAYYVTSYTNFNHTSPNSLPAVYTGIVPGARVYSNGRLSPMLYDRVKSAADLYKARKIKRILLSGDHGQKSYDEVNAMRRELRGLGVPERHIFLDHAGFSTYDTMYRAASVFKVKDAVIITQKFHLPRAVFIARKLNLEAYGYVADRREYTPASHNWSKFREFFSASKAYFVSTILKPAPLYLGQDIPITGDAAPTKDKAL